MNWNKITKNDLEEEWKTESLDSLFFQSYQSTERIDEVKKIFFEKFESFTALEKINAEQVMDQLYNGKTLDELKNNTAYMGKNVDIIVDKGKHKSIATPLFIKKNNGLEILGGRTRASVAKILGSEIVATVIDYEKMKEHFPILKEKEFLDKGFGELTYVNKRTRLNILHKLKKGKTEGLLDGLSDFKKASRRQKYDFINKLKDFLLLPKENNSFFLDNGEVNEKYLAQISSKYTSAKRNKKGKVNFKAFANTFGHDKSANIGTAVGYVEVLVNSQFWKMLKAKENRENLLFNIKDTLKDPIFIIKEDESYKFYACYKKANGKLFHMLSVCSKNSKGELVLKTSYQLRVLSAVRKLAAQRGEILYCRSDIDIKRDDPTIFLEKEVESLQDKIEEVDKELDSFIEKNNEILDIAAQSSVLQRENKSIKARLQEINGSIKEGNKVEIQNKTIITTRVAQ